MSTTGSVGVSQSAMPNAQVVSLTDKELPALYYSADEASVRGQRIYLRLVRADLILVVLGGLATAISFADSRAKFVVAVLGAVFLGISAVLTWVINLQNFEKVWYGGRAIAESVKTLSWRYACCAEPFISQLASRAADDLFISKLTEILNERKHLGADLGGLGASGEQITAAMRRYREQPVAVRKDHYLRSRIDNQQRWYTGKSGVNKRARQGWFVAVIVTQFCAMIFAVGQAIWPTSDVNLAPVIASAAASFLAWLQVKQHQELAQSYGLAAHELGMISAGAAHVATDEELSKFVSNAENAISREHTLWIARRDTP